ncbi:SdpI family protein [Antrihabitans sp. YC2-6]|uniref:SdpI family protein n=1 Tax=Antrihabitans sp. YC2-6 TaxID=2799498 RepID=UPI0018F2A67F|nr:SdpI family protein [Antrihabitans sp. YC2-6]MBJ8347672.1 SdpI family protein [Antrihabitans sp. YC2-6]
MLVVASLFVVLAVVAAVVGVAGLAGRLPRNRWVGIRTEDTLRDDAAFALANKVAAPTTIGAGLILFIGGIAALTFSTVAGIVAVVVTGVAAIAIAGIGGSIATRAAAVKEPAGGCGQACGGCSLKDACEPS